MGIANRDAIKEFRLLLEDVEEPLGKTFKTLHQEYVSETLMRFLIARDGNVAKAHKMLIDCLDWRMQNEIDNILAHLEEEETNAQAEVRMHKLIGLYRIEDRNVLLKHISRYSYPSKPRTGRVVYHLSYKARNCILVITKPIIPYDLYRAVRDSQLVGLSGYTREGIPVVAVGVGLSTFDKASIHYYVQSHIQMNEYRDRVILPSLTKKYGRYIGTCVKVLDMTGLKLLALNQIKLLTVISTIDDLNYPEKTETYYVVNVPYIFSACWKVVKPLLKERTRRKIQVLSGCGRDELLKIMDYASLPHFCKKEGLGSSKHGRNGIIDDCFSLDHEFHQQLYNYTKQLAALTDSIAPMKQGSVHVDFPKPDPEDAKIVETIQTVFHRLGAQNGLLNSLKGLKVGKD